MEIRKLLYALALLALSVTACQKDTQISKGTNLPVVEAYLVPGQPITVKLYRQKGLTDTAVFGRPITGLTVFITAGSDKLQLTESKRGVYTYADQRILATGRSYILEFEYNDYKVSATTLMPPKPVDFRSKFAGITLPTGFIPGLDNAILNVFSWSNPNTLDHVLVFKETTGVVPVERFGTIMPVNSEKNTDKASYYNVTADDFGYVGRYKAILFCVNPEYINLLENLSSGSSSQTLNQIPTNIINGFGIFTAMQADTLDFNVY